MTEEMPDTENQDPRQEDDEDDPAYDDRENENIC
jgi:hypothetical protein